VISFFSTSADSALGAKISIHAHLHGETDTARTAHGKKHRQAMEEESRFLFRIKTATTPTMMTLLRAHQKTRGLRVKISDNVLRWLRDRQEDPSAALSDISGSDEAVFLLEQGLRIIANKTEDYPLDQSIIFKWLSALDADPSVRHSATFGWGPDDYFMLSISQEAHQTSMDCVVDISFEDEPIQVD
jgi:hypothetical protein